MKTCSKCKTEKPKADFYRCTAKKDGVHPHCKPCDKLRRQKWTENNREQSRNTFKLWAAKNPDYRVGLDKKYRENNREKLRIRSREYRKNNPEARKLTTQKWDKKNPDKKRATAAKYRAKKLQATPHWLTENDHREITKKYEYATYLTNLTGEMWHVDHIHPLQGKNICGLHVPSNLQVIPATENLAKSNKYKG